MTDDVKCTENEFHRKCAVDCFNHVWTLLEIEERTPEQDDEMVHSAHASRYHWGVIGEAVNRARGEWQISRVYASLESAEPAKYHGLRCLDICQENSIGDFDLAYAYEALARASEVADKKAERDRYLAMAKVAGEKIEDEDNKKALFDDLGTILA